MLAAFLRYGSIEIWERVIFSALGCNDAESVVYTPAPADKWFLRPIQLNLRKGHGSQSMARP